jgi:hypothetical protein
MSKQLFHLPSFAHVEQPPLERVREVFDKWLVLRSPTPIYAVLGTIAANRLSGDPVWLGLIAPPSTAKTELINALTALPHVVMASTLTPAALLSGTPKHQKERGTKGGLLRQIGEFGILVLKDFGSILSMRPEARAEAMGALREIYDGYYPRHLGTGGGRTLEWQGKLGLIFCATEAYDAHHAVIGVLGDRFLLCRLEPASSNKQFDMALRHAGAATSVMRAELAAVVAELFARELREPRPLGRVEHARLRQVVGLAVRLRGGVERDRRTRELDQVYGAEGPGRLALSLERLLAGLDALGLEREAALKVVEHVAMSSTPPIRRHAWEALALGPLTTRRVADRLRLPTSTARRALEELMAHGLVVRLEEGGADKWRRLTADDT